MNFSAGGYSIGVEPPALVLILGGIGAWFGLLVYPLIRILRRMGYSGWWVLLAFTPLGIIGLQVLAYGRWPTYDARNAGLR